jgi:glycosyltransferase involved in cell wall biosynthesis
MNIIITAPSLDTYSNVSGISSVTNFVIKNNPIHNYVHFALGKSDNESRFFTIFRIIRAWIKWVILMIFHGNYLIHFNFALDKRSIIRDAPLILFARVLHRKMVIHIHGGEFLKNDSVPTWIKTVIKLLFSGQEPKIVLSPIEEEIVTLMYDCKNVIVLPNCIDLRSASEFNRLYPTNTPVKLLFLGRIVKMKGIEYILKALTILVKRKIDFKFILAGSGPDQSEFVNKCNAILGSAFEFKGVISGQEKVDILQKCDIFLLPSLFGEGLPISLLESMSFELVSLVTDDGSMKHIIKNGENGIIVEKGSSTSLAEAIEHLILNTKILEKIGKNARQYIFENHDPVQYINKLNEIYNNA